MSAEPEVRTSAGRSTLSIAENNSVSSHPSSHDKSANDGDDDVDGDGDAGASEQANTPTPPTRRKLAKPKTSKRRTSQPDSGQNDPDTSKKVNVKAHSFDLPKTSQSKKRSALEEVGDIIAPKKAKKKVKLTSGRAPVSRRIVPNYDSEDEIIVDMKQAGYPDEAVVKRLIEESRTRYDPKSIASRWQRIRKAVQAAEDELLDEELTDWHEGEDDLLKAAYTRAETKLNEELERLRQKKYSYVAQELNKRAARPRFSARACKERFEALEDGTARMPPELDPDPEGRARERAERIGAFKIRKQQELEQQAKDAEEEKRAKSKKHKAREEARKKQEAIAVARAAKKKEENDFKEAKFNALKEKRLKREQNLRDNRDERFYLQAKRKCETALLKRLQKEGNARSRRLAKYSAQFPLPKDALNTNYRESAVDNYDYKSDLAALESRDNGSSGPIAGGRPPTAASSLAALANAPSNPNVNVFGTEPRQMLKLPELYDIMRERGMLLNRMKEVKGVVLQRLDNEDARMSVSDLRTELRKRGLLTNGTKKEMVRRMQEDDAKRSSNYKRRYGPRPLKVQKAARGSIEQEAPATPGPNPSRFSAKSNARHSRYNAREVNPGKSKPLTKAITKPTISNPVGSSIRVAMRNSKADSTSANAGKDNAGTKSTSTKTAKKTAPAENTSAKRRSTRNSLNENVGDTDDSEPAPTQSRDETKGEDEDEQSVEEEEEDGDDDDYEDP